MQCGHAAIGAYKQLLARNSVVRVCTLGQLCLLITDISVLSSAAFTSMGNDRVYKGGGEGSRRRDLVRGVTTFGPFSHCNDLMVGGLGHLDLGQLNTSRKLNGKFFYMIFSLLFFYVQP